MATEKAALSPRETAIRMLEHANDDVSYEDLIRQLRILQQIEWVMKDIAVAGVPSDLSARGTDLKRPRRPSFDAEEPSFLLRSRPLYSWRSLAERSEDRSDSFLEKASWIY